MLKQILTCTVLLNVPWKASGLQIILSDDQVILSAVQVLLYVVQEI